MSTIEIKQNLIQKISSLRGRQLHEVHGMIMNYVNSNTLSWENLEENEKAAIEEGLSQLDSGRGVPHQKVIEKIRKRYSK